MVVASNTYHGSRWLSDVCGSLMFWKIQDWVSVKVSVGTVLWSLTESYAGSMLVGLTRNIDLSSHGVQECLRRAYAALYCEWSQGLSFPCRLPSNFSSGQSQEWSLVRVPGDEVGIPRP